MYELGERIKISREAKKYTQIQLAKIINKSASMISNYESGAKAPATETLIAIAQALDVSLDYLVGIEKKRIVVLDGLTQRQTDTVLSLVTEFRDPVKYPGLTQRQQDILNHIMLEFSAAK